MHLCPQCSIDVIEYVCARIRQLSHAAGAIANFIFNVRRRHPSGDKPLVDW